MLSGRLNLVRKVKPLGSLCPKRVPEIPKPKEEEKKKADEKQSETETSESSDSSSSSDVKKHKHSKKHKKDKKKDKKHKKDKKKDKKKSKKHSHHKKHHKSKQFEPLLMQQPYQIRPMPQMVPFIPPMFQYPMRYPMAGYIGIPFAQPFMPNMMNPMAMNQMVNSKPQQQVQFQGMPAMPAMPAMPTMPGMPPYQYPGFPPMITQNQQPTEDSSSSD